MTHTKTLEWQVIEDNGGGLHLAVFDGGNAIYYAGNQERNADLLESIEALRNGDTTADWDGNSDTPQAGYDSLTSYEHGWSVIADNDGIYRDRMGAAGREAFKTAAERVAEQLGNDGQTWETPEGKSLDALATVRGAYTETHPDKHYLTRYVFGDGSAIVASESAWDIEGPEPFSWAGE